MTRASRVMRRVGFGLMAAFTLLFGLFAAGYAFEDPGGWQAVGVTAAVAVPLALLTFVAYRWPGPATWVLAVAMVLLGVLALLDALGPEGRAVLEAFGPVVGLSALMVGLPMATLGLTRPMSGGLLLVGTAVLTFAGYLPMFLEVWLGLGAALTTSSTVIVVPFLVVGVVFVIAALVNRSGTHTPVTPTAPLPPVGAGV